MYQSSDVFNHMIGKLILENGLEFEGISFGKEKAVAGEVVFSTGMVGYPESFTDPSYFGQILILTYPLIGNYGVPDKKYWESEGIKISGLVVSNYIDTPSHFQSKMTLSSWLKKEGVPALEIQDTRLLTQIIREKGTLLGKMIFVNDNNIEFYDPNKDNLVAKVSTKNIFAQKNPLQNNGKTVLLIDCGVKRNISRCLLKRGVSVITVPWDFDPFHIRLGGIYSARLDSHLDSVDPRRTAKRATSEVALGDSSEMNFDGIVISNGPGDPKMADKTIKMISKALDRQIPTLGICLGNQLLALSAGGDTQKLKFGHRSQNQPCLLKDSKRCFITTQNHGFAVSKIPQGFETWFENANDNSNEGIIHKKYPFMSVQFHPEASPGPTDTEWVFDYFLKKL